MPFQKRSHASIRTEFKKGHPDLVSPEARKRASIKTSAKMKGRKLTVGHKKKLSIAKMGVRSNAWKGGKVKHSKSGYTKIFSPNHSHKDIDGYVAEHRLVMEKKIGRLLEPDEIVHHINYKKDDNRPENLFLMGRLQHNIYEQNVTRTYHKWIWAEIN